MAAKLKFDIGLEFFRCGLMSVALLMCGFVIDVHLSSYEYCKKEIYRDRFRLVRSVEGLHELTGFC